MTTTLIHEPVRAMVSRLSVDLDGVELVAKAVLDELGTDPDRLRAALAELLPDFCGTQIRTIRNGGWKPGRKPGRSAKLTAIRDWHAKFLTLQLHVPDGYRRMADCTADDLLFAVGERKAQAAATLSTAAGLERLQIAMQKHKARVVSDLAREIVRAAIEGGKS